MLQNVAGIVRTTIMGGVMFLVPFAIVLLVLGKVFQIAVRTVLPLAERLPVDSLVGLKTPWVMATVLLLGVCFLAGVLAKTAAARKVVEWLETTVLSDLPGYSFLKSIGEELVGNEPSDQYASAMVRLDDGYLLGFLVEKLDSGHSVVFLPGAPKPWAGDVMIVEDARVTLLTPSSKAAVDCLRRLGAGSGKLLKGKLPDDRSGIESVASPEDAKAVSV